MWKFIGTDIQDRGTLAASPPMLNVIRVVEECLGMYQHEFKI